MPDERVRPQWPWWLSLPLTLTIFGAAFGCGPPSPNAIGPPDGRALYGRYCAACHGPAGANDRDGAAPRMRLANSATVSEQDFAAIVAMGRGAMPPFRDRLGRAEIEAIARYVRVLYPVQRP